MSLTRLVVGSGTCVLLAAFAVDCGAEAESSPSGTVVTGDEAGADGPGGFAGACDGAPCPARDSGATPGTCGDGILLADTEGCDDGNVKSGDGCSATCTVEPGWLCPTPGLRCQAAQCGDGVVAGAEECDYKPGQPVAGCSPTTCRIEPGFDCNPATLACSAVVCGDGKVQRGENCEDGNALPFDGCFECRREPSCANGVCKPSCGDGQRFVTEACDDGNTRDGDGCSATCAIETGFACTDVLGTPPTVIHQPVLIRDFIGVGREAGGSTGHTDFNGLGGGGILGIVEPALGGGGRPVLNCPSGNCLLNPGYLAGSGRHTNITTAANFAEWYTTVADVNLASMVTVPLARQLDGTYTWDSADPAANGGKSYFDPVGSGGWVGLGKETLAPCGPSSAPDRNVSFTSETHFWFEYQGGERFDFAGDDDTWVFVNGKLAIDLGGLHTPRTGLFTLDPASGVATFSSDMPQSGTVNLGLTKGGVYEVVMFQAERNQCGSNFRVTLKDFNRPKSACASTCGDGVVASDELCDDGINDGRYGGCMPGCKARGPFCGDGHLDPTEDCDEGALNGALTSACTVTCKRRSVN